MPHPLSLSPASLQCNYENLFDNFHYYLPFLLETVSRGLAMTWIFCYLQMRQCSWRIEFSPLLLWRETQTLKDPRLKIS